METWTMVGAKRARNAERPTQPSLDLTSRAPWFYPDPNWNHVALEDTILDEVAPIVEIQNAIPGYRQGPEIYETYAGLVIAVENECAAAAVVGARLGLEMGALLFCSDNTTLPKDEDRLYGGLRNPDTRRGFEAGLSAIIRVLTEL